MRDIANLLETKKSLLQTIDEYIRSNRLRPLYLFGDITKSQFIKSVWQNAIGFGFSVSCWSTPTAVPDGAAAVVDFEHLSYAPNNLVLVRSQDVDRSYFAGTSACAEAIYALLTHATDLHSQRVVIIGRGHAVKGLAAGLITQNAAVSVVHSQVHQKYVQELCKSADIVINAAPHIPYFLECGGLLLDVGSVANYDAPLYFKQIGLLTTAYLLKRCVHGATGECHE